MPNHITNVVTAPRAVLEALLNDKGEVDFERVVPRPANIETGGCPHYGDGLLPDGTDPKTGLVCWYWWASNAWGTKWNAYESEVNLDAGWVKFQTAWSTPGPVMDALSLQHPGAAIRVEYADEDYGFNVGTYDLLNGEPIAESDFTGTQEGRELAARLQYGMSDAEHQEAMRQDEIRWAQDRLGKSDLTPERRTYYERRLARLQGPDWAEELNE